MFDIIHHPIYYIFSLLLMGVDSLDAGHVFEKELNKLLENEDYIESIRETFLKNINNTKQYKSKIDELLKFSRQNNLYRAQAWGYYYFGWYNFDISEYEEAVNNFVAAYDLFEKYNQYDLSYACNGLTNVYCQMGQYKLANEWGLKGISYCEETKNDEAMIILLLNTCINYIQMEYFEKALDIVESIEGFDRDLTVLQKISHMLSNAEIGINMGSPDSALRIIDDAMIIESGNHLYTDISEMFKLKGMAYVKKAQYTLAEEQFEKSYNFCIKNNLIYEKCSTMLQWSKLCMLTEKYEQAIDILDQVILMSSSNKYNPIMREAFYSLYTIYKKKNITDKALLFLERYIKVDDEMYDYEQSQLMAKMNLNNTKRVAEQYKQLATYDCLTKFYTKLEILKFGDKVFDNYRNNKQKFSLIMMDLDNFKIINDTYGHIYGDKALSIVAETISKCIRNTDLIGRFGGDEFLLICPDAGLKEALDVAERIRASIEKHSFILGDGVIINLTLSLGVYECNLEDKSFTDTVKKADKCLYTAKNISRNIVICE